MLIELTMHKRCKQQSLEHLKFAHGAMEQSIFIHSLHLLFPSARKATAKKVIHLFIFLIGKISIHHWNSIVSSSAFSVCAITRSSIVYWNWVWSTDFKYSSCPHYLVVCRLPFHENSYKTKRNTNRGFVLRVFPKMMKKLEVHQRNTKSISLLIS